MSKCPVCLSIDGFELLRPPTSQMWTIYLHCPVCGMFGIDQDLVDDYLSEDSKKATRRVRAVLSHWINLNQRKSENTLLLSRDTFDEAVEGKLNLPTPAQVALAIIQHVGDYVRSNGDKLERLPVNFSAQVGATSRQSVVELIHQLGSRGLVKFLDANTLDAFDVINIDLSLDGWESYQSEKVGKQTAGYGFLAMKFGDQTLEMLAQEHLKPAIKGLGYELVDMRDVAEPGIIDNIMRMRIRDANFVIVDLTHDNSGAYWEAGYAEGLGKPVLYICEEGKFSSEQTHFDTNHCTTVMWSADSAPEFCDRLIATLRRAMPL